MEALLLDDSLLTELRTAAVGALATKLLGPKTIKNIGIVGTGVQARYQLNMLSEVSDCRRVLVWGRTLAKVNAFISEMSSKGYDISSMESPDELLETCDLIVTTTCSRQAVLGNTNLRMKKGQLINCIGADAPGKIELSPSLVAKADLLVADLPKQSVNRGEFQKVVNDGLVKLESIASLGTVIEKGDLHRGDNDDRLVIFDSSGVALQDCIVSSLVLEKLGKK